MQRSSASAPILQRFPALHGQRDGLFGFMQPALQLLDLLRLAAVKAGIAQSGLNLRLFPFQCLDIAGQGRADPASLIAALRLAADISGRTQDP